VTLPTPVFLAGGALCLMAGYITGAVTDPGDDHMTTATVVSFDADTSRLCLEGDAVEHEPGVDDGVLCGTWNRGAGATPPEKGDRFRFVTMDTSGVAGAKPRDTVIIYGTVVD
jgi:hypothetical protein